MDFDRLISNFLTVILKHRDSELKVNFYNFLVQLTSSVPSVMEQNMVPVAFEQLLELAKQTTQKLQKQYTKSNDKLMNCFLKYLSNLSIAKNS